MKKIFLSIMTIFSIFGATSCSDMLETDSSRQVFDPSLDSKTDSMFYAFGVMQALQQLGDQYVLQGELRGELVSETEYTDNNLRQLMHFNVTEANRYDSAYVYYRVINNCNYYIANRDTTLSNGSSNVVMQEYVGMKAFRAWAYLQLARNYGKVPFFTEPLMSVSQIEGSNFPEYGIKEIAAALCPDLRQYSGIHVPTPAGDPINVGAFNFGTDKQIRRELCFIPVDVILGELYLEAGDYANAATYYSNYLITNKRVSEPMTYFPGSIYASELPSDFDYSAMRNNFYGDSYTIQSVYSNNPTIDIITYIPMAVNRLRGTISNLSNMFGYDLYGTSSDVGDRNIDEVELTPSPIYHEMVDTADYYYYRSVSGTTTPLSEVAKTKWADKRGEAVLNETGENTDVMYHMIKYQYSNIVLYRLTTVYLHLAEALNRLGYPDAAFAILKEGINEQLIANNNLKVRLPEETDEAYEERAKNSYITDATVNLLTNTYPFLSTENQLYFNSEFSFGIHMHGAGVTHDGNFPGRSPYQFNSIVGAKMDYVKDRFGVAVGTTKQDTINAVEDLLCDEYALEFAFEGRRFYDLCRLARHKNEDTTYGANFGGRWLTEMLKSKNVDLTDESSWYLPFTGRK